MKTLLVAAATAAAVMLSSSTQAAGWLYDPMEDYVCMSDPSLCHPHEETRRCYQCGSVSPPGIVGCVQAGAGEGFTGCRAVFDSEGGLCETSGRSC